MAELAVGDYVRRLHHTCEAWQDVRVGSVGKVVRPASKSALLEVVVVLFPGCELPYEMACYYLERVSEEDALLAFLGGA